MPYGIDPNAARDYVLEEDRELEEGHKRRTVFKIRTLKSREMARIEDGMAQAQPKKKGGHIDLKVGSQVLEILDAGLVGVENFHKPNGEPLIFDLAKRKERLELYDWLSGAHRQEIADAISSGSTLTEEQVENLS